MVVGANDFRATLGRWASGVSVVTTRHGDRQGGMTVTAFSSVSLEPPLVLICAALSSETCGMIQHSGWFAVNVLSEQQRDLSQRFADPHLEGRRFEGLAVRPGQSGLPLLPDVAASLECKVTGDHVEGDHRVFIGQVVHAERSSLTPLLFLEGRYGTFAPR